MATLIKKSVPYTGLYIITGKQSNNGRNVLLCFSDVKRYIARKNVINVATVTMVTYPEVPCGKKPYPRYERKIIPTLEATRINVFLTGSIV